MTSTLTEVESNNKLQVRGRHDIPPPRPASGDTIYIIHTFGSVTNSMSMLACQHSQPKRHIITNRLDDSEDIYSRRCNLIGQINSILCYFRDLDSVVKARLMKCYCFSMYGCILWDFNNTQVVFLQSMAQGNETVFWPAIWLKFIYFACALSRVASVSWNVQAICAFYH